MGWPLPQVATPLSDHCTPSDGCCSLKGGVAPDNKWAAAHSGDRQLTLQESSIATHLGAHPPPLNPEAVPLASGGKWGELVVRLAVAQFLDASLHGDDRLARLLLIATHTPNRVPPTPTPTPTASNTTPLPPKTRTAPASRPPRKRDP